MKYSILGLLALLTYTAIAFAAFSTRSRPIIGALSIITISTVLSGLLAAILRRAEARTFWIGFTIFSAGYLCWMGDSVSREYYSPTGMFAEWTAFPKSYNEELSYDALSRPSRLTAAEEKEFRGRLHYTANCLTSVYLGIFGGFFARVIVRSSPEQPVV